MYIDQHGLRFSFYYPQTAILSKSVIDVVWVILINKGHDTQSFDIPMNTATAAMQ